MEPDRKCTTCFSATELDYLNVFAKENVAKNIPSIVGKHLWLEIVPTVESQWICVKCWSALDGFHNFYIEIEALHHRQTRPVGSTITKGRDRSTSPPNCTGPAYKTEFLEIKGEPLEEDEEDDAAFDANEGSDRIGTCDDIKSEDCDDDETDASQSDEDVKPEKDESVKRSKPLSSSKTARRTSRKQAAQQKPTGGGRFPPHPEEDESLLQFYKRIVCEVCDNKRMMVGEPLIEYATWGELLRHTKEMHGHYKIYVQCPVCEMKLRTKVTLVQHMDMHKNPDKYRCEVCHEVHQNMKEHMQNKHEERQFHCELCESKFPFKKRLVVHMKKMHAEKNVTCDQCQKAFTKYTIEDHKRSVHTARFVCEHCPKTFKIRFRLQKHMQEHDKSLRISTSVPCPTCGQVMGDKYILRQHIRHMHAEQQSVDCETCGKTFKNKRNLSVHLANVCMKPVQLHPCSMCGKQFRHKNKLKDHMSSCTPN